MWPVLNRPAPPGVLTRGRHLTEEGQGINLGSLHLQTSGCFFFLVTTVVQNVTGRTTLSSRLHGAWKCPSPQRHGAEWHPTAIRRMLVEWMNFVLRVTFSQSLAKAWLPRGHLEHKLVQAQGHPCLLPWQTVHGDSHSPAKSQGHSPPDAPRTLF